MQDIFIINYKTVLIEIKQDLTKWKDVPCSWIGKLKMLRYSFPHFDFRTNTLPITIPADF